MYFETPCSHWRNIFGVIVMARRRIMVFFLFSAALVAAAVSAVIFLPGRKAEVAVSSGNSEPEIVEVELLSRREGIEVSGNIEPVDAVDLAFPIAGYIERVLVSVGDYVNAGETVAVLEDSQQRFNLAEVDVEIDQESVSGTQRNLELLELKKKMKAAELEDTRLKSTISGIVTGVYADPGDFVTAQQAGSAADVIVRVINREAMIATVEVDELDAPYLSQGQRVEFQFDAYPDLSVSGEVSMIPLEARVTSQGIAVLDTEVSIPDPPQEILPFFTFAGEIFLDAEEDILLIPVDAVMERGDRKMVFTVVSREEADAARGEKAAAGATGGGPGGGAVPGGMGGGGVPGGGALTDIALPEGLGIVPTQVAVSEFSTAQFQVLSGLKAGDRILVLPREGSVDTGAEKDSGGTNILDLLGLPSGGPGSRLPGGGGSGGGR
jgi:multidrug efflux pump subunit AcrA (membrane-fusion protein)